MIEVRFTRVMSLSFDRGEVIAVRADLARQLVGVGSATLVEPERAIVEPPETRERKKPGRPRKNRDES
jgi:hypothetical protein